MTARRLASPRVAARQILIRHLSMPDLLRRPFPDRLAAIMADLTAARIIPQGPMVVAVPTPRLPTPGPRSVPRQGAALGAEVRAERARRGWTLAALATKSGISAPTICRIQRGDHVSAASLRAVLAALDLPVES